MNPREAFFAAFASSPRPAAEEIVRADATAPESGRLREFLARIEADQITAADIRSEVSGNLSMLTPKAFRYFLPACMAAVLEAYPSGDTFIDELVSGLTKPHRQDVVDSFDLLDTMPPGVGLSQQMRKELREQQIEWVDSGIPLQMFHERMVELTDAEGAAVLEFLEIMQREHGEDFPSGELDKAIERHWVRYRQS